MKHRIGVRLGPGQPDLAVAALGIGFKHFDVCLSGGVAAPPPEALIKACEATGLKCGVDLEKAN